MSDQDFQRLLEAQQNLIGNDFIYFPPKNTENSIYYDRVNFIGEIYSADNFEADQIYI